MVAAMARVDDQAALAAEPGDLAHERAKGLDAVFRLGAGIFSILVLLIAWELFARSGKVTPFMLPPFSAVVARIYADAVGGDLWINLGLTLYRSMTGFCIATVGGIALGAAMSRIKWVHWFFDPIISVGFPMPKIAFLPVIMLWLGLYDVSKISIVVFDAIFPVVTATLGGIASVEKDALVGAQYGRQRAAIDVADRAAGGASANPHRPAGGAADLADRRHRRRDGDGRLRARRRHDERVALCRLARRLRRHRRDRHRRLCADQGHGADPPPAVGVAPGNRRAQLISASISIGAASRSLAPDRALRPQLPLPETMAPNTPGVWGIWEDIMRTKIGLLSLAMLVLGIGQASAEPVRIRVAWVAPVANWISIWLDKKDLAKHFGQSYVFEPVHFAGTPPMVTAIANNEVEIGDLAYSTLPIAIKNAGMDDIRIIADDFQDGVDDHWTIRYTVLTDGPIKKIKDLKGKVLATNAEGSAVDIAMKAMLHKHGLENKRDYTVIEAPFPAMKAMLAEHKVDLIPGILPFALDPEMAKIGTTLFTAKDAIGVSEFVTFQARKAFIDKNRAALVDWLEDTERT